MTLLTEPVLIVDQVTAVLSNDFEILDSEGTPTGVISTQGSLMSRMFLGSRRLTIRDADGSLQVSVDDVMTLGRDRYVLAGPDGARLATLRKELKLVKLSLTIDAGDGQLSADGDFFEWNFTVQRPDRPVATFRRTYAGIGRALLGHNRYVITFDPAATEDERRVTLGIAVAVDLIRAKNSAAVAGS